MKRKTLIALLACTALAATGCGSKEKETEAPVTEAVTTEAAVTEETTTEEAATEEVTSEAAATEEETTEEVTTEETTTEAVSETETETEAASEEEITEAVSAQALTETETEAATTEAAAETETETEEETTEAATETETETEEATVEATSEAATEEATTEEVSEDASETETAGEEESESETETELYFEDLPEYVALDYVTLGEYKGLTVEVEPIEVTDEEVEEEIKANTIAVVTEGTVEEGDVANIDYEGKREGVAFDGGTAAGYDLEIGSGTFIEGFEEGLVGAVIGETIDLNLTFPEEYHSEELAGQEVVFTVTVNSVQRAQELTDEVAAGIELEDGTTGLTAEEYREAVRADLEEEAAEEMKYNAQYDLLAQVVANATINGYPEDALNYNKWRVTSYYEMIAQMSGMEVADMIAYYGMDMESYETMVQSSAEEGLAQSMVLAAIAEAEGMEVTAEVFEEGLARYTEIQGYANTEDLLAAYGENYIKNSLMQEMALEFLYENAVITEPSEEETSEVVEEVSEGATEVASEDAEEASEVVEAVSENATETETEVVTEETTTEAESETETVSETETEA